MKWYKDVGARSIALFILVVIAVLLALCSCTTQYVPIETVRTEYKTRTDTFIQKDTVEREKTVTIMEADSDLLAKYGILSQQNRDKQKTILILQKEIEREKSSKQEVHTDTVIKTDSVQVPYPVERKLTKWEQLKIDIGGWMIGVITVFVFIFCVYLARCKVIRGS